MAAGFGALSPTEKVYFYASQSPWHYAKYRLLTKGKDWHGILSPDDVQARYDRQNGRCAYTGWQMSYEPRTLNLMSIDHIVPLKRGGKSVPANAQLVCWFVNRMKTDIQAEVFLAICRAVAREHPDIGEDPDRLYDSWRETQAELEEAG